jgi:hypothetical protein
MDKPKENTDTLVISYKFPPSNDINGIVLAKRIINAKSVVDVILNKVDEDEHTNFDEIERYINNRFYTSVDYIGDTVKAIFEFNQQGLDIIGDKEYKKIYSSSWALSNHFLALEYKFKHPDVFWTAEFSDPLSRGMDGKLKEHGKLNNDEYIDKVNSKIKEHDPNLKLLENPTIYTISEYLTYIFADKIVFTNINQKEMMLELYDENIKEIVENKAEIAQHPTLEKKYYHLVEKEYPLNHEDVNIAYFGNFYYAKRHFEALFYAYESLNHKFKDRIKLHIFINDDALLKMAMNDLTFKENVIIQKPLDYFEFLNATTQFDILLVNDAITEGSFKVNPYIPSKLSDYRGSGSDIWSIYENGSQLSKEDAKYKSSATDFNQTREVLINILKYYGYDDENLSFNKDYLEKRLTDLNKLIEQEFKAKNKSNRKLSTLKLENKKLKNKIKKVENENSELLSSNSWKITKPLRSINKIKK